VFDPYRENDGKGLATMPLIPMAAVAAAIAAPALLEVTADHQVRARWL
jgi:hypothetical protein